LASDLQIAPGDVRLRLTEIFFSLQGESSFAGLPCVMIRLTGCNLRCTWCDTEYSFHGGEWMTVDEILVKTASYGARRVEITGGEPLLQKDVRVLAQRLLDAGYTVLCETSGERDIDILPREVHRIVDFKAPASGESHRNDWANVDRLTPNDEVKFVVQDRADFDWMLEQVERHRLAGRAQILVAPVYGVMNPTELAGWLLASGLDARLNLQVHKLLWGETPGT
jgi:7-carboxy-7-deazaguanine synthase